MAVCACRYNIHAARVCVCARPANGKYNAHARGVTN